jgi:hypothetical protein
VAWPFKPCSRCDTNRSCSAAGECPTASIRIFPAFYASIDPGGRANTPIAREQRGELGNPGGARSSKRERRGYGSVERGPRGSHTGLTCHARQNREARNGKRKTGGCCPAVCQPSPCQRD